MSKVRWALAAGSSDSWSWSKSGVELEPEKEQAEEEVSKEVEGEMLEPPENVEDPSEESKLSLETLECFLR